MNPLVRTTPRIGPLPSCLWLLANSINAFLSSGSILPTAISSIFSHSIIIIAIFVFKSCIFGSSCVGTPMLLAGETRSGRSAKMSSPILMSLVANTPNPISGVVLMTYAGCMPHDVLGFGTGLGYPGVLTTLAFVGPETIHSLCPSGSSRPVNVLDGIVVMRTVSIVWSVSL